MGRGSGEPVFRGRGVSVVDGGKVLEMDGGDHTTSHLYHAMEPYT